MAIRRFLQEANPKDIKKMLWLTLVAGCANAFLIVVINQVAVLIAQGQRPTWFEVITFLTAFVLYYVCNKKALLDANNIIENLLKNLRINIADKLRQSELRTVNKVGRGRLYSLLAYETNHLSVTFPILVENFQQAVLLAVAMIYLGYLSLAALAVFFIAVLCGILIYAYINENYSEVLETVARQQEKVLDLYGDLIHGSKEIRLNQKRSKDIMNVFFNESDNTEELLTNSGKQWTMMVLLSAFVMDLMLGIVAFVFPHYIEGHSDIIFQLIPTLLFCFAPLSKMVAHSPLFIRAGVGLSSIYQMEKEIESARGVSTAVARNKGKKFQDFKEIRFKDVIYEYTDKQGAAVFTSGPWDLEVKRGELTFLVGGNGSGKSTALRLMSGLYNWDAGQLFVDGDEVTVKDVAGFRELFTTIFSDFHLFDRLYGLEHVDPEEVEKLLKIMDLADKVQFKNGRFSDTHLSTGQRKRLALITAILEDRPIYLLDEWSAEQDVHFREYFYTSILTDLRARGKTVIVVTHDERFWHLADRVVKFDLGQIEWDSKGDKSSYN
ncbi:cyclic peptide export ABC transporter [Kordiimonas pumila]|uniref:Cyclic peptide export ABC transporter n=1 Tax=Kordiimonas pumila TaxID=2161677 RepID=A0ABV7D321_9PROT|nr:cyclic peptide export ABC transporter [Kordiimonas pumila]